ncbi:hypothetical protein TrVFT333_011622 [Trichoderma virens FT-333]|nr:hypothetical protein TrVFT333_011622 [Trichoderma virens FT-333]
MSDASIILGSDEIITLNGSSTSPAIKVLDYGFDVEGFPTFEVVSASGDTSCLEITYSETKVNLNSYMGDGPLPLAAAMDTYRINQYNITNTSTITNHLIMGGFRYQKLNLSTDGELVLTKVGVKPTTSTTALVDLPGSFECSDEDLTRIWRTGARTVQLSEIPANSIPAFWKITPEGSFVESQAPQVLSGAAAAGLMQYKVDFDVKPISKGFGFSVLADTLNSGIYIFCNLANGSISAHLGSSELDSAPLASASLPGNITLGEWHHVSTSVDVTEIAISINKVPVLSFSQTSSFFGSFGLGASFGHSAVFRDLSATTLAGAMIYSSSLTDGSHLKDFLMGTNPLDAVVDGSKRDRIAYTGDLDISASSAFASTGGISFVKGTLDLAGSYQLTPGFFVPTVKIQQAPLQSPIDANITGLIGYSFSLLTAAAQYYQATGDVSFAKEWAPKVVRMLDWANSQVLPNGLLNISTASFGGDWNFYDPPQSGVVTKFNVIYAYSLQETMALLRNGGVDTTPYQSRLVALRAAIDAQLWSDSLGAYFLSEDRTDGFAQDANALAILAGIPSEDHSASAILSTLSQLSTPAGPLSFSNSTEFKHIISPYASAYHLRAAFQTNDSVLALGLLKSLWEPMADPGGANYTNCFWEALDTNGAPGLGRLTSLCHGWASGPTAELSKNVLGIQAVKPGFSQWLVSPQTLNLTWAKGAMPIPNGRIAVSWNFTDGLLAMSVESPIGTNGTVFLPSPLPTPANQTVLRINGRKVTGDRFTVYGGETFALRQIKI